MTARGFARASSESLEMAITFNPVSIVSSGLIWFKVRGGKKCFTCSAFVTMVNASCAHAFSIHNNIE